MKHIDLMIIGAGPVGLMSAYLAQKSGLSYRIIDRSSAPLSVGRADALNARSLQLMEIAKIFDDIYPLGLPCNTSSVFKDGAFRTRTSKWWDELEGCLHKHFLMLGQAHIEKILNEKIKNKVQRNTEVLNIEVNEHQCLTKISSGEEISSKYIIGCDGPRSFVRKFFDIGFEIERPQINWMVIDAELSTNLPRKSEIIVFQRETADIAWIPREGKLDRFYIRMDEKKLNTETALELINNATAPYTVEFNKIEWLSDFEVKESVAQNFRAQNRVFLAGDSCHIHSVNGGQGLNTGIADAFNLIWKLATKIKNGIDILDSYESERKPVAMSVIETSGELVRKTKFAEEKQHADDYLQILEKRAGNITGMGITYPGCERFWDFTVTDLNKRSYELLDYSTHTLFLFNNARIPNELPPHTKIIKLNENIPKRYQNRAVLVRPDGYLQL